MCHDHGSIDSDKTIFLESSFLDFLVEGFCDLSLVELDFLVSFQSFIIQCFQLLEMQSMLILVRHSIAKAIRRDRIWISNRVWLFASIYQGEWSGLCWGSHYCMVSPETLTQFLIPVVLAFRDELLEKFVDGLVKGFCKAVDSRVVCPWRHTLNFEFITKSLKCMADKLGPIIVDDSLWHAKAV